MDAFGEIGVFARVVERRTFTRAAQALGLTPTGGSRIVSRLDQCLRGGACAHPAGPGR